MGDRVGYFRAAVEKSERSFWTLIGIDCAVDRKKVGLARGRLHQGRLTVTEVRLGSNIEPLLAVSGWIEGPTLIALDAPLGWPAMLGDVLVRHAAGCRIEQDGNEMFMRHTDRVVWDRTKKRPLEVGADRIARTAVSALCLLTDLRARTGIPIPLMWRPGDLDVNVGAIEVYPAVTLKARGLNEKGYKGNGVTHRKAREVLRTSLAREFDSLVKPAAIVATDHSLDAVLCLLAAADFLRGEASPPPPEHRERARREGWIWVRHPEKRIRPGSSSPENGS